MKQKLKDKLNDLALDFIILWPLWLLVIIIIGNIITHGFQ